MKNKIIALRNFLNRNKIFFEILSIFILSTASIFVSIKANNIANQANNISQNQTDIMELENTPRIEIQRTPIYTDFTESNNITKWLIFNNNSKVSNFEIEKEISYLIVKKDNKEINVPLVEYLNIQGKSTGLNEGLIYEFDNKYCSQDEFLTRQEVSEFANIDIKSFIEISYKNVLGKKQILHFQISPMIQPISDSFWKTVNKDWSDKNTNAIYLKDIKQNVQKIKDIK